MSSSRYQSRVLQAIAQQTLRWRDRALKSLRQIRLTLTWSTQILLYPIYVALQSSRLVGRKIGQAVQRFFPKLTAIVDPHTATLNDPGQIPLLPASDRPIQTILPTLQDLIAPPHQHPQTLPFPVPSDLASQQLNDPTTQRSNSAPLQLPQTSIPQRPQDPTIYTLATLISGQKLVLVSTDNAVHDILTVDQQQQLHQQIVTEMANYWCDRRQYIAFQIKQARNPLFLPMPQERPNMLPPVRFMQRFIAWMQTSPLAIATNLFQESALVPPSPNMTSPGPVGNPLGPLPLPLALWFDPDYHGSKNGWFNANQINQVRRQREFPPVVPSLPARIGPSPPGFSSNFDVNAVEMTGEHWIQSAAFISITAADLTETSPFPTSAIALFVNGDGDRDNRDINATSLEYYLAHHGVAYDFRQIENPAVDRAWLDPVPQSSQSRVASSPNQAKAVDTTAELVAYEKHPLERLLGWIDQGMAWIETRIAKVWTWWRDRV